MTTANAEVKTAVQCASASYYGLIRHLVGCFLYLLVLIKQMQLMKSNDIK